MRNELKPCQKHVITNILMSYPAIKDYRNQAYHLSYPNANNIEVRRCRVSVLNIYIYIYMHVYIYIYILQQIQIKQSLLKTFL